MSPRARHAKSKSRIERYESLLADSGPETRGETQELFIPPGPRLGDVVVRAEGVRKSFGDRLLMEDLSFDLPRGGIVGVIGPNGAGKTTLFKMIVGKEKPDAGKLAVGESVVLLRGPGL
jgi:ATPase subunit of ABC transporter with duplicated ATPase domains